jgi:hypothetical protein
MARADAKFLKDFWKDEAPSGTINGSNTVFTLSQVPNENESVDVFVDGLYQTPGTDYTLSSVTITFTTAPAVGQSVRVSYIQNQGE